MAELTPYKAQSFGGPTLVQPVRADGLLDALQNWQAQANKEGVEQAVVEASQAGALAGGPAAAAGESAPVNRLDTQAGRAFAKAAEATYLAQIENDVTRRAAELEQEHYLDPGAFGKATDAHVKGLTKNMDAQTVATVKPRVERIFSNHLQSIVGRKAAKDRETAASDILTTADSRLEELSHYARAGDWAGEELHATFLRDLNAAVGGGLISAERRDVYVEKARKSIATEEIIGNYEDAEKIGNGAEFIEKLKGREVKDLAPGEKDQLVAHLETLNAKEKARTDLGKAQEIVDTAVLMQGSPEDKRTFIRRSTANPEVRQKAETLLEIRLDQERQDSERAEKDRIKGVYENVVKLVEEGRASDALTTVLSSELPPEAARQLETYTRDRAAGREILMGPKALDDYRDLREVYVSAPGKFLEVVDLARARATFDDKHYDAVVSLVGQARKEVEADEVRNQSNADREEARQIKQTRLMEARFDSYLENLAHQQRIRTTAKNGIYSDAWRNLQDVAERVKKESTLLTEGDAQKAVDRAWSRYTRETHKNWLGLPDPLPDLPEADVRTLQDAGAPLTQEAIRVIREAQKGDITAEEAANAYRALLKKLKNPTAYDVQTNVKRARAVQQGAR